MPRLMRRSLLVLALLGAWALLARDHAPLPFTVGEAVAGPAARGEGSSDVLRNGDRPPHDLSALKVFNKVVIYVKDEYVDPKRINPREMMVAALEQVERTVPDVMVEADKDRQTLHLNVNGKTRDFDISHVDSLWKMSFQMKDVFEFIGSNLRPSEDTRDVEYAAVNGMLSTLDPHSVLLKPEYYREMRLTTKGEFGGLGFVIQMKESNLTVVRVLPKTPASRAGIKKDDQIKKIGEESTVNMDLNEAVSKLRGPVDSRVTITVERKGLDKPMVLTLARAIISIESVQSKLLAGNVGYVRLKNFQGNTTRDMQAALSKLTERRRGQRRPEGPGARPARQPRRAAGAGHPGLGPLPQPGHHRHHRLAERAAARGEACPRRRRRQQVPARGAGEPGLRLGLGDRRRRAEEPEPRGHHRPADLRQGLGAGALRLRSPPGTRTTRARSSSPSPSTSPPATSASRRSASSPTSSWSPPGSPPTGSTSSPRARPWARPTSSTTSATPPTPAAAKKREEVLGKEKPFVSIRYLKEDAKQKDAAARQQKAEEGKDPKLSKNDKDKAPEARAGQEEGRSTRSSTPTPTSWTRTSTTSSTPRPRTR